MKHFFSALSLIFIVQFSQAQTKRVWIDTDILTGKFKKDVDDALALVMALRDTSIEIVGISVVQNVDYSEKVTRKLLNWYDPNGSIQVYKGADGSKDAGKTTDASTALIKELEKGKLHILALGPITTIATVLDQRKDLQMNIESITFCAGRTPGMLFNPGSGKVKFSDYNFDLDPNSMNAVLDSDVPLTLAGYDCSDSLFLSKADFIHLKESENEGDRWLYKQMKSWEDLWRVFMGSDKGFIPFDAATLGVFLYEEEFEIESTKSYIQVDKNDSKNQVKTDTKPYLFVGNKREGKSADYCSYTKQAFKAQLLKAIHHPDYR